jgi:hypothetical protein
VFECICLLEKLSFLIEHKIWNLNLLKFIR